VCHYAKLTSSEPAVNVTIVYSPLVVDELVKLPPTVIVASFVKYLSTTIPEPPAYPLLFAPVPPPPPFPVLAAPVLAV